MTEIKMVVGLGNPGKEYERTRHNIGFRVIDLLAGRLNIKNLRKYRFGWALGRAEFEGKKLILLKPLRYMNCSGEVVAAARVRFGPVVGGLERLLVVTDDMALEPGRIRIRARGSAGGHNGLADMIEKLHSSEFARLRVGIGRGSSDGLPPRLAPALAQQQVRAAQGGAAGAARDYVLSEPTLQESELIEQAMQRAQQAVLCWVGSGVEAAMNEFNS